MQKNHLKRDLTRAGTSATFTTRMPSEDVASKAEKDETKSFRKPRRAASAMRRSVWPTGRISPLSATSP